MAGSYSFRNRSDLGITDWNQAGSLAILLVKYTSEIGDAQVEMLRDPTMAIFFVARTRYYWGFIRAILLQRGVKPESVAKLDDMFPDAEELAQLYASGRLSYKQAREAYDKLMRFSDKIKLVTQLTGFAIPIKKDKLSPDDKIGTLADI